MAPAFLCRTFLCRTGESIASAVEGLLQRAATAKGDVMSGTLPHGYACVWQETLLRTLTSRLCSPAHTAPFVDLKGDMLSMQWLLLVHTADFQDHLASLAQKGCSVSQAMPP